MDLRIVTTVLFFLSLYLHTSALDDLEIKPGKHPKHSVVLKRRKQPHKPTVPELKKPEKERKTIVRKTNTPKKAKHPKTDKKDKNENFLEFRRVLQGRKKPEDIQIVDTDEIPAPEMTMKNNESRKSEPLEEPATIVKEIIYIRGIHDIRELLKSIELEEEDKEQESRRTDYKTIPGEAKAKITELREQLRRDENGQPKVLEESSGEENIIISEEARRSGGQSKEIEEEDVPDDDSKPNTLKKYIIMKGAEDNPPSRRYMLRKSNKEIDKIPTTRKSMVEEKENVEEEEEEEEDDSPTRKQVTSDKEIGSHIINKEKLLLSAEEDENTPTIGSNRKLAEEIYGREPISNSIENYIYVGSPSRRRIGQKQIDDMERKYGIHKYPDEDFKGNVDITREYIIVRDKTDPARRQTKKTEFIETNSLKRKSNKIC